MNKQCDHMYQVKRRDFICGKWICGSDAFLEKSENFYVINGAKWIWSMCYCRVHLIKKFNWNGKNSVTAEFWCDNNFTLYINGNIAAEDIKIFNGDISTFAKKGENTLNIISNQTDKYSYFTSALIGKITADSEVTVTDKSWKFYNTADFWENEEPENFLQDVHTPFRTEECPIHPRAYKRSLYMRKKFFVKKEVLRATLFVSYRGEGESYINSRRTDTDILPQGINGKYREYRSYAVGDILHRGENVLGFITANGWLNSHSHTDEFMNKNKVIAELEIEYTDGEKEIIGTDNTYKTAYSPMYENDIQYGERYNALNEISSWCDEKFDDSIWECAQEEDEEIHDLVLHCYPPVKIIERIKPKTEKSLCGGVLFDFGVNGNGRYSLEIIGAEKGQEVRTEMFERFSPQGEPEITPYGAVFFDRDSAKNGIAKGNVRNIDVYICKGGKEKYEPHFTFTGFRYIIVYGLKREQIHSVEMTVMHTDVEKSGEIDSNYGFIKELCEVTRRTMLNNLLNGPMDCPTREKNFWTGDTQLFAVTACYLANQRDFLARWTDGGRKMCDKFYGWGDEIYILPWVLYKFYGDKNLLETRYRDITNFAQRRILTASEGLPKNPDSPFNDHLSPDRINLKPDYFAGVYYCYMLKTVGEIAHELGRYEDSEFYGSLLEKAKKEFMRRYFIPEESDFEPRTQSASVLPLAFDIVPEEYKYSVASRLNKRVIKEGHITCGYAGTRYLFDVLAEFGYTETVFMLLDREEFPSWKYILKSSPDAGGTLTESWRGYTAPPSGSMDHFALGSVTGWMFEYLGGIRWQNSQAGFSHITFQPVFIKELGTFKTEYKSCNGKISVEWYFEGENVVYKTDTCVDCTVILPDKTVKELKKGKNTIIYNVV